MEMRLNVFVICLVFVSSVVAPPPLEVELRAEKEYMLMKKLTLDKSEDTLDVFNDNLIEDSEDDDLKDVIEDTNADISKEFDEDEEDEESDEFVPVSLSGSFDKYDLDNDNFIDKYELMSVTGVIENNNLAMEAADSDGDDRLSRDEFEKGPWELTVNSDSADDEFDDVTDDVESEIIDFDDDKFDKIMMKNEIFDKESKVDENDDQYLDDRDFNSIISRKSEGRQTEDDDNEIVKKRNKDEQQNDDN